MPLETMVLRGVLADVDHLGAGVGLLVVVGQRHGVELAHRVIAHQQQLGYFQVMAEPVSTWVHEIFEFTPRQAPRLVTKL
jgi:hypothetical protein